MVLRAPVSHAEQKQQVRALQQALANSAIFGAMDTTTIVSFARSMVRLRALAGQTVFEQGEAGNWFYVVLTGKSLSAPLYP